MKTKCVIVCIGLAMALARQVSAQADVTVSGANGSGTGGSVSYSVGQVVYTQHTGTGGSLNQGVQQTYSITEMALPDQTGATFRCDVFPNPTFSGVKFVLHDSSFQGLSVNLTDLSGKVLLSQSVLSGENEIPMAHLPAGTYVLCLNSGQTKVQSFKIIKY